MNTHSYYCWNFTDVFGYASHLIIGFTLPIFPNMHLYTFIMGLILPIFLFVIFILATSSLDMHIMININTYPYKSVNFV